MVAKLWGTMGSPFINAGTFTTDPSGRRPMGRKPGVQNKATALIKNKILEVFQLLQEDPEYASASLSEWAKREPGEFYKIASKILPLEIEAKVRQVIVVKVLDEDDDGEEELPVEDAEFEEIDPNDLL